MHAYATVAEAARRVRSRYTPEDMADLLLNRLIEETRRELEILESEQLSSASRSKQDGDNIPPASTND